MSESTVSRFPLQWPEGWARSQRRRDSQFKVISKPAEVRDQMIREVALLGGTRITVSTNVPVRAKDGLPFAEGLTENLSDPGVAVYFERKDKPLVVACDTYRSPVENMRAISLCVEGMRTMKRHGATELLERQFTGFTALPPKLDEQSWWQILGVKRDCTLDDARSAYRDGMQRFHPDRGGDDAVAAQINRAWEQAQDEKGRAA